MGNMVLGKIFERWNLMDIKSIGILVLGIVIGFIIGSVISIHIR